MLKNWHFLNVTKKFLNWEKKTKRYYLNFNKTNLWIKSLRKKRKFCIYNNKKSKKSRPLIRIRIRTKVVRIHITAQPLDHYTLRCGVKMERLFNQIFCNTVMTANIFHIGFNICSFFQLFVWSLPEDKRTKMKKK